jgi:HEAT repeat protein
MPAAANRPRRRRLWIGGVILLLAIGLMIALFWPEPEPLYDDRTIAAWSLDLISLDATARSNATVVLRAIGPEAIPPLVRQLDRRETLLKRPFVVLAPRLPVTWRRKFIGTMQPFHPADERLAAATALALFGTNSPPAPLLGRLRDVDSRVSTEAANALAAIGPAAVPGFIEALDAPEPRVRALACYGLSRIGRGAVEAAPALVRRLSDRELQIAGQAANALLRIGPAVVPELTEALSDPDSTTRYHAARTLGALGRSARSAVPALLEAARDTDPVVSREARNAIRIVAPDVVLNEIGDAAE